MKQCRPCRKLLIRKRIGWKSGKSLLEERPGWTSAIKEVMNVEKDLAPAPTARGPSEGQLLLPVINEDDDSRNKQGEPDDSEAFFQQGDVDESGGGSGVLSSFDGVQKNDINDVGAEISRRASGILKAAGVRAREFLANELTGEEDDASEEEAKREQLREILRGFGSQLQQLVPKSGLETFAFMRKYGIILTQAAAEYAKNQQVLENSLEAFFTSSRKVREALAEMKTVQRPSSKDVDRIAENAITEISAPGNNEFTLGRRNLWDKITKMREQVSRFHLADVMNSPMHSVATKRTGKFSVTSLNGDINPTHPSPVVPVGDIKEKLHGKETGSSGGRDGVTKTRKFSVVSAPVMKRQGETSSLPSSPRGPQAQNKIPFRSSGESGSSDPKQEMGPSLTYKEVKTPRSVLFLRPPSSSTTDGKRLNFQWHTKAEPVEHDPFLVGLEELEEDFKLPDKSQPMRNNWVGPETFGNEIDASAARHDGPPGNSEEEDHSDDVREFSPPFPAEMDMLKLDKKFD